MRALEFEEKGHYPDGFFQGTIYFAAQEEEDRKRLYADLSQQLAKYGLAEALIVMKNGNATHIAYLADSDLPGRVYYRAIPLKPGEFDTKDFKSVYQIPDSSIAISSYGGVENGKSLIHGIQAPRPIKDEFLVLNGTPKTGLFTFAGTKWTKKDNSSVIFENNGKLTFDSEKGGAVKGDWKIENNVLYFHYGRVYVSAVFDERGDSLISEIRTLFPPGFFLEGNNTEMRSKFSWARTNP